MDRQPSSESASEGLCCLPILHFKPFARLLSLKLHTFELCANLQKSYSPPNSEPLCMALQRFRAWRKGRINLELRLCIFGVAQHVRTTRSHTLWTGLPQFHVQRTGWQTCSPQPHRKSKKHTFKNRATGAHPLPRIYIEA